MHLRSRLRFDRPPYSVHQAGILRNDRERNRRNGRRESFDRCSQSCRAATNVCRQSKVRGRKIVIHAAIPRTSEYARAL